MVTAPVAPDTDIPVPATFEVTIPVNDDPEPLKPVAVKTPVEGLN